jgi:outer membrane usher protein
MAKRSKKTCRWPRALAEVLLLQGGFAAAAHAADVAAAAAPDAAPVAVIGLADTVAGADGQDLYLDVTLNGMPGGLAHFALRNGELWASLDTLRHLGFSLPQGSSDPVRLASLAGVQATYDPALQAVRIVAPLSLLRLATSVLNAPRQETPEATASPGLLVNYDLFGVSNQHDGSSLSGFAELRAFGGPGVLSSTQLLEATHNDGHGQSRSVRLDTTWSRSFAGRMLTFRVGDTLTGYLPWTRPTRIGGVQIARNFALQPYRITAPLPSFLGSATLPSDVELYVDGIRQYSGQVPAGPFQLNTVPNISGSGNAQVVMTDSLGRTTTLNFSLYAARQLLQQGLSDWSVEVGAVRRNYGLASFDYGHQPVASGTWRYGVTDNFTAEAHGEATAGLADVGAGGNWLLGGFGVVSAALAQSRSHGERGSQWELGYEWRDDHFNFSVSGTRAQGRFRDTAALNGSPNARVSARGLAGYTTETAGSFGVIYLHLRFPAQAASRYATGYWFKTIGPRASLSLNLTQNLDSSRDRSIYLGFTLALEDNTTFSSSIQRDSDRTAFAADAARTVPLAGGLGWRAEARQGDGLNGGLAEVDYLGSHGLLSGGVNAIGRTRYAYAQASGAIVLMDGHSFVSRRIDDAFALVSTDGIAGVPVKLENRPIGHTDRHGLLLVEPLNAYQTNRLSIDPMSLPVDVHIDQVKGTATPADRAGTLVRFGIRPVRAATVVLVDAQGKPLPLGSTVRPAGATGSGSPVGYDGEVYLEGLQEHNLLHVTTPTGTCTVRFDDPGGHPGIPQIGPLPCLNEVAP